MLCIFTKLLIKKRGLAIDPVVSVVIMLQVIFFAVLIARPDLVPNTSKPATLGSTDYIDSLIRKEGKLRTVDLGQCLELLRRVAHIWRILPADNS
jgi:hypothetical protein